MSIEDLKQFDPKVVEAVKERIFKGMRVHKPDAEFMHKSGILVENGYDQFSQEELESLIIYTFHDERIKASDKKYLDCYMGHMTTSEYFDKDRGEPVFDVSCIVYNDEFYKNVSADELPGTIRDSFEFLFNDYITGDFFDLIEYLAETITKSSEEKESQGRETDISSVMMKR